MNGLQCLRFYALRLKTNNFSMGVMKKYVNNAAAAAAICTVRVVVSRL